MPISPDEAAKALDEINRTVHHSRELQAYEGAAPYFLLWGLVWAFGYTMSDLMPENRNLFWALAIAFGSIGSILLAPRCSAGKTRPGWQPFAISGGLAAFFAVTSTVLSLEPRQIDAFVPLIFAGIYLFAGIWVGTRFSVCGIILAAGVVIGYFNAGPHFSLWMACIGGGVLVLTSFWLRSA